MKPGTSKKTFAILLSLIVTFLSVERTASAVETWEQIDKRIKSRIYQINVGLRLKLKDGRYVYHSDKSPKNKYDVFSTSEKDLGYRVVGCGTSFPVKRGKGNEMFFLTNRHVVESAVPVVNECQRFFVAIRLYADQTASNGDTNTRFEDLLNIIRLPQNKKLSDSEKSLYGQTVDAIWDSYDTYILKNPQGRGVFQKYARMSPIVPEIGYFLHPPGPVEQKALTGQLYRVAQKEKGEPDIAILTVKKDGISPMELDTVSPAEGQEVQVIGYPIASDNIDLDSEKYYAPTFTTGRISRVAPRMLQVDASVTSGNSGGPVVNLRGKVVGVVTLRAMSERGEELTKYGGAINISWVRSFAPELLGSSM